MPEAEDPAQPIPTKEPELLAKEVQHFKIRLLETEELFGNFWVYYVAQWAIFSTTFYMYVNSKLTVSEQNICFTPLVFLICSIRFLASDVMSQFTFFQCHCNWIQDYLYMTLNLLDRTIYSQCPCLLSDSDYIVQPRVWNTHASILSRKKKQSKRE